MGRWGGGGGVVVVSLHIYGVKGKYSRYIKIKLNMSVIKKIEK